MNTQTFDNMSAKVNNATDYCQLLNIQNDINNSINKLISGLVARISKLGGAPNPNSGNLSDVANFAKWLYGEVQSMIAAAQADYVLILALQAKITALILNKLTQLEKDALAQLPAGTDLKSWCATKAPTTATPATQATPVGDRNNVS